MKNLIVGVFSPVINWCGGAEWVAVNIVNTLRMNGYRVIVLSDKPLNQIRFEHVFNRKVLANQQIVFPLRFFSPGNYHNIYTDALRSLMLKLKCNVMIDTFSNTILPGANVSYIHYPLMTSIRKGLPYLRNKFFFAPFQRYLQLHEEDMKTQLIFANSKFTAEAIRVELGIEPYVLYPSVSNDILDQNKMDFELQRGNNVITVSRIASGKNLEIIPQIAKSTDSDISFTIVGLLDSERLLHYLLKLINDLKVSDRVRILTNIKRKQLSRLLQNSKVYLHPTTYEHFGISIIEAMASGCIPVVHNSGGPREFVPKHLRFESLPEAAEKVEKAIDCWSPSKAKEISKDVRRFSEGSFSKQFIDIFNSHFHALT